MERFCRTEMLIGKENVKLLSEKNVAVFGLGGVGGYVAEALARGGVGKLTLIDFDVVTESNINRQLYALNSTLGQFKTEAAKERISDINPYCQVDAVNVRFDAESLARFDFSKFDYVADAIDTVTSKLLLVETCVKRNVPVISCMGAGNKLDAAAFKVADISQTSVCPLARVMRRELKKRGVYGLKVVYSEEQPKSPLPYEQSEKRQTPGSVSFVPPVAGFITAGEIIKDLTNIKT